VEAGGPARHVLHDPVEAGQPSHDLVAVGDAVRLPVPVPGQARSAAWSEAGSRTISLRQWIEMSQGSGS
jgi:hypothetical protein